MALIGLSLSGAAYAYQSSYTDKALYGSKILGEEMGGLNYQQIEREVRQSLEGTTFKFTIDGKEIAAKPEDIGVTYHITETAQNIYQSGKNENIAKGLMYGAISLTYRVNPAAGAWLARGTNFRVYQNVPVVYTVDEKKIDSYTKKLSKKFNSSSKDASLVIQGTDVKVVPAVYGRAVATASIKLQIKEALRTGQSASININVAEVRPEIIEAEAADAIAAAEEILKLQVVFMYSGERYVPTKQNIGSWIVFKKSNKKLMPVVDSAKINSYLATVTKDINIAAVNQKVKVVNSGKRQILRKGKNGLAVNTKSAAAKAAAALNSRNGTSATLTTYVVRYKTEINNVLVANWDKYIEVNISTQRMCAYLSGGELVKCWAITTGQYNVINGVSTRTPTGTFLIRRKSGAGGVAGGPGGGGVCMPNPPYDTPLCGINYVSTFTPQGHAIHEAWWRSSFGTQAFKWNGSHGCVNAPYDVARFIYNWAPVGTPVVIHY